MVVLKRYWIVILVFILVGLIYFSNPLSYLRREIQKDVKTSENVIDSLNKVILNIKPSREYLFKIDSLELELKRIKDNNYVKTKYIYINSSFDEQYDLLTSRISKDTLK